MIPPPGSAVGTAGANPATAGGIPTFAEPDALVVRYSEIFLKGENRRLFEDVLVHNLESALRGLPGLVVRRLHARIVVERDPGVDAAQAAPLPLALPRVLRVFGVSSAGLARTVPRDLDAVTAAGVRALAEAAAGGARSFKVRARRTDKRFPFGSFEINDTVGDAARRATGLAVDVHRPDLTLTVEIARELSFVSVDAARGPGGLPVGVSGQVTLLLSGGIDSPVAGWLCQKRGCRVHAVHFHSFPHTGEASKRKALALARELGRQQGGIRVTVVPFAAVQEALRDRANPRHLVVLYRRAMARLAERVALAEDSVALATGENLGQVASQTIHNLGTIGRAVQLPVLRPLLTYDKGEIVTLARRVGTYDLSVEPHADCCSLFVPRHPATRVRDLEVERAEHRVGGYDALLDAAFAAREHFDFTGSPAS